MPSTSPLSSCATRSGSSTASGASPGSAAGRSTTPKAGSKSGSAACTRPRASTTKEPPSKISSSLPPTWFTNDDRDAMARRERRAIMRRRSRALPTCHGEPRGSGRARRPPRASSPTGSIGIARVGSTQVSSQTVRPERCRRPASAHGLAPRGGLRSSASRRRRRRSAAASSRATARRCPPASSTAAFGQRAAGPAPSAGSTAPSAIATRARGRRERVELAQLIAHEAVALEQVHRRIAGEHHLRQRRPGRRARSPPSRRPPRRGGRLPREVADGRIHLGERDAHRAQHRGARPLRRAERAATGNRA